MKRAATGSLLGLALGDALGYPTEFDDVPSILATCGPWREMELPSPAHITDDTQMTLALSRALRTATGRGALGPKRLERPLREEFVDWYQSPENNRAPGNTCMKACYLLKTGKPWEEAGQVHSKGCGANMRVAPLGLLPGIDDDVRAGAAQLQSALTHGHTTALAASDLTAYAVRLLARGAEPMGLVGLLRSYAGWRTAPATGRHGSATCGPAPGPPRRSGSSPTAGTSAWPSWSGWRARCGTPTPRPTPAWPRGRAGSPNRRSPPACSAS